MIVPVRVTVISLLSGLNTQVCPLVTCLRYKNKSVVSFGHIECSPGCIVVRTQLVRIMKIISTTISIAISTSSMGIITTHMTQLARVSPMRILSMIVLARGAMQSKGRVGYHMCHCNSGGRWDCHWLTIASL